MRGTVELLAQSYYSFLDAASSPEELVEAAVEQGVETLALVDRNGLYGAIPFYQACKAQGVQPILGARLTLFNGDSLCVLCPDQASYHALSTAISQAYQGRDKGDACLTRADLKELSSHGLAIAGGPESRLQALLDAGQVDEAAGLLDFYKELFGERLSLAEVRYCEESDCLRAARLDQLSSRSGVPLLASGAPRYARQEQAPLYDVLRCIKTRTTLNRSQHERATNHQRYIKTPGQIERLFHDRPRALERAVELAQRCDFSLDHSSYRLPDFPVPEGEDTDSYLRRLCLDALPAVYPEEAKEVYTKLEHELALIAKLELAGYFLVVWDLVQFARRKGIPVQGRGSAANSLVAYILGITPVDPIKHRLFLGRFINEDMVKIPDIDLDFASSRDRKLADREDVIKYVYERYGHAHVAMVCTFVTFQARSALREVGRVFELPSSLIDQLARLVGRHSVRGALEELKRTASLQGCLQGMLWEQFARLLEEIAELPRHVGIHVGGMIIAARPIAELVPIEPARMEGRFVCQWDKDMVEDAGLIKVDILGLGMLAVLRDCERLLEQDGRPVDLWGLPMDDPRVYAQVAEADTVGVFQIESRAQMQSLPRTRPQNFDELGIQVALIRPGPLQGNMVSPYILRKQGLEELSYLHPSLEPVLKNTLGVILFQEQVLQVAVTIAGFSPAEADSLRRAMSRRRSRAAMEQVQARFMEGAARSGVSAAAAQAVYQTLEGFALYGFCKSHALSFARLTYLSAWLKRHEHAAFTAALLNNQPMGFYSPESLVEDAKRHGVEVLAADINQSEERCTLEKGAVRLGLKLVQGLSEALCDRILQRRAKQGGFASLRDFYQCCQPKLRVAESLVEAGVFDGFGLERRELLWQLWILDRERQVGPSLFDLPCQVPPLPKADVWALMRGEFQSLGISLQGHPMLYLRPYVKGCDSRDLRKSQAGTALQISGMVTCRQRPPTAKGFAFLTLEDEYGMINLVIAPKIYERDRRIFRQAAFITAFGHVDARDGVINLRVHHLAEIQEKTRQITP